MIELDKMAKGHNLVKFERCITLLFTDRSFSNFACYLMISCTSFFPSLRYIEICKVSFLLYKHWRPSWICAIFRLLRENSAWCYLSFDLTYQKL